MAQDFAHFACYRFKYLGPDPLGPTFNTEADVGPLVFAE